jgi:hypothetical protein
MNAEEEIMELGAFSVGPASLIIVDLDGNVIMVDQHVI